MVVPCWGGHPMETLGRANETSKLTPLSRTRSKCLTILFDRLKSFELLHSQIYFIES